MVVTVVVLFMFGRSRYSHGGKAIRDDEIAAGACELNTTYLKVLVFAISAFSSRASPAVSSPSTSARSTPPWPVGSSSINYVIMVVFGGMGSLAG